MGCGCCASGFAKGMGGFVRAVATISALVLFAACAVQLEGELESVSLEGFDFNPKAPDVTIAPVDVVCEISLYVDPGGTGGTGGTTPAGIGIRDTGCVFMSPNGLHSTSCVATNPTIGDIFDGTWECTARVDMAVEDGTWKVSHVFARDYEYKHVSVDTAGLAGFPTDLIVT